MAKKLQKPSEVIREIVAGRSIPGVPMPCFSAGAPSLRAYRQGIHYAADLVLHGKMTAREGAAFASMMKTAAELLVGEKSLALQSATGDVQPEHPLGDDGGLARITELAGVLEDDKEADRAPTE